MATASASSSGGGALGTTSATSAAAGAASSSAARRKQDERNLKMIRELVALAHNKYCFECNQRGPTYVDVTIGSFVCTKCSGLLRGITPPHRVKSISMTTFTTEEIELMRSRGNHYCHQVWLGLFNGSLPTERDEAAVQQLMIDKYERRRYYMEPSLALQANGIVNDKPQASEPTPPVSRQTNGTSTVIPRQHQNGQLHSHLTLSSRSPSRTHPSAEKLTATSSSGFVADFDHAVIVNNVNNNNGACNGNAAVNSFADFDNNPAFNNTDDYESDDFSIFDLQFSTSWGPMWNEVPLFPKVNVNRMSEKPNGTALHTVSNVNGFMNSQPAAPPLIQQPRINLPDKYAALKDLDNELRFHQPNNPPNGVTIDWGGSNNSLYPTSSPPSSSYGSPTSSSASSSQGPFNPYQQQHYSTQPGTQTHMFPTYFESPQVTNHNITNDSFANGGSGVLQNKFVANPFGATNNGSSDLWDLSQNSPANVFQKNANPFNSTNGSFVNAFPVANGATNATWNKQNPFKVASNGHSNNPFL